MGLLPTAETTARPLWIPHRIRAGKSVAADPRETRLAEPRQLTFDGTSGLPAWSGDGKTLYFVSGPGCATLRAVNLESGAMTDLATPLGPFATATRAGERLVHARCETPGDASAGTTGVAASAGTAGSESTTGVAASAGTACARRSEVPRALPSCELTLREHAEAHPLVKSPGFHGDPAYAGEALVFTSTRDGDAELYRATLRGDSKALGELVRLTSSPGYDGQAALSADRAALAWVSARGAEGDASASHIYLGGPEGQHPERVTHDGRTNLAPAFVPGTRGLAFTSDREAATVGDLDLFLLDVDAPAGASSAARLVRLTFGEGFDGDAAFSPDGRYLAFASSRGAPREQTNVFVATLARE